jgi:pyruvate ferredoxin oxidoreductase beta subunit
MPSLKQLSEREERLSSGHRLCAGCGASVAVRQILISTELPIIACASTGCLEVATTIYPFTAWKIPFIHNAFENAAATISGVESMYRALKKRGRIPDRKIKFVAFGGDGGTYDIGLQSLSGALERGHDFTYVCYDNQAYMNTGIQRSSATPIGANTTTSPCGDEIPGKRGQRKNLTQIVAAHDVPYAAQSTPSHYMDLIRKAQKAIETDGPTFLNVLSPCPRGWRSDATSFVDVGKTAVETCVWPLYEIEDGNYVLNGTTKRIADGKKDKLPVEEWLKLQGRFKHLFKDPSGKAVIEEAQSKIDRDWERLKTLASI